MGAHWRHLANTTEPSMCGGDAALCQITLITCCFSNAQPWTSRWDVHGTTVTNLNRVRPSSSW